MTPPLLFFFIYMFGSDTGSISSGFVKEHKNIVILRHGNHRLGQWFLNWV